MRTPCGLPDHGRDIGKYEFSSMNKLALHCAKASDTVSKWPAWKQNLLDNSPTREKARAVTTGEFYVDPPRPQPVTFEIKDAPRCEAFDELVRKYGPKFS